MTGIYIGDKPILSLDVGTTPISEVYVGATKVWPQQSDRPVVPDLYGWFEPEGIVDDGTNIIAWNNSEGPAPDLTEFEPGQQPFLATGYSTKGYLLQRFPFIGATVALPTCWAMMVVDLPSTSSNNRFGVATFMDFVNASPYEALSGGGLVNGKETADVWAPSRGLQVAEKDAPASSSGMLRVGSSSTIGRGYSAGGGVFEYILMTKEPDEAKKEELRQYLYAKYSIDPDAPLYPVDGLVGRYDPSDPLGITGSISAVTGLATLDGSAPNIPIRDGDDPAILDPDGFIRRTNVATLFRENYAFPTKAASVFLVVDVQDFSGNSNSGAFSLSGSLAGGFFGGMSGGDIMRLMQLVAFSGITAGIHVIGVSWEEDNGSPVIVMLDAAENTTLTKTAAMDDVTPSTLWYGYGRNVADPLANRHGEMLVYDRALTIEECRDTMTHLMNKWTVVTQQGPFKTEDEEVFWLRGFKNRWDAGFDVDGDSEPDLWLPQDDLGKPPNNLSPILMADITAEAGKLYG